MMGDGPAFMARDVMADTNTGFDILRSERLQQSCSSGSNDPLQFAESFHIISTYPFSSSKVFALRTE